MFALNERGEGGGGGGFLFFYLQKGYVPVIFDFPVGANVSCDTNVLLIVS